MPHPAHIEGEGAQPGRKTVWIAQRRQLEPGFDKRVVGQILRVPGRTSYALTEAMNQPTITRYEFAKGVSIAGLCTRHQCAISSRSHRIFPFVT